ncbi:hypothetical protein GCM10007424_27600 [Flavobacterium suaedae]|uniref:Outer membrane protein beta-barrel domain-containing protein n=1 Tax=Flavobacterium suaedae TaxID=1767027 RepID=A0ABQ1K2G8_9FLAO|nr:hypothetical protein [Flavobacterium suaedae]GGB86032.1 hypothetical protein GCM10007424_27600 [Flavobacterium suaedae]
MKKLFLFLFIAIHSIALAQTTYNQGYYIDNNNNKTECLIRSGAWQNNSEQFRYKFNENSSEEIKTIEEVKEFYISNEAKFKRFTVAIDKSSTLMNQLSESPNPEWATETIFLKVLVEGDINLYEYQDSNIKKYFFSTDTHEKAEQLMYREYKVIDGIRKNNHYRQQLYNLMKDRINSKSRFEYISYKKNSLTKLFLEYNGDKAKNLSKKEFSGSLNVKITAGLVPSSLTVNNNVISYGTFDFGNKTSFRIGTEVEYIMPFNKNKWAIFLNPNYYSFNGDGSNSRSDFSVKYHNIELPLGIRYYFYLNTDTKFYINPIVNYTISLSSSKLEYTAINNRETILELPIGNERTTTFAFGTGFAYKNFSIEGRFHIVKDILKNYNYWDSELKTFDIILGYKIF